MNKTVKEAVAKSTKSMYQRLKNSIPRGTFSKAGGMVGSYFGGPVGSTMGASAGALLSKLVGFGDYKVSNSVKVNSITNAPGTSGLPTFDIQSHGVRIRHKETLGYVTGSTSFSSKEYPLNVAQSSTFPWLSQVACLFDEYEVHGLVFAFSSTQGSIAASSPALGTVLMATQYDAYEPSFTGLVQMLSYQYSTNGVPTDNIYHGVECDPSQRNRARYYTRPTASAQGSLLDYDVGKFTIATEGMQSPYNVGLLSVIYDVTLRKPRICLDVLSSKVLRLNLVAGGSLWNRFTPSASQYSGAISIAINQFDRAAGVQTLGVDTPYYFDPDTGISGNNNSLGKIVGLTATGIVLPQVGQYELSWRLSSNVPGIVPAAAFNSNFLFATAATDPTPRTIFMTTSLGANIVFSGITTENCPGSVRIVAAGPNGMSVDTIFYRTTLNVNQSGSGAANRFNISLPSGTGKGSDGTTDVSQPSNFTVIFELIKLD